MTPPPRLYLIPVSNSAGAGAGMVEHKCIRHRKVWLLPGLHPLLVRFAGFPGHTVPALAINGHMVQGTRRLSRFLDGIEPDPPLFPVDTATRRRVEDAERWGERALQQVPRRLFVYSVLTSDEVRHWLAKDVLRMSGPRLTGRLFEPVVRAMAAKNRASEDTARFEIARLPALLDRVDELIADGTIGGAEPNAADFQILASVRVLLEFEDLGHMFDGRACVPAARRLYPRWAGPIPGALPTV